MTEGDDIHHYFLHSTLHNESNEKGMDENDDENRRPQQVCWPSLPEKPAEGKLQTAFFRSFCRCSVGFRPEPKECALRIVQ